MCVMIIPHLQTAHVHGSSHVILDIMISQHILHLSVYGRLLPGVVAIESFDSLGIALADRVEVSLVGECV